MNGSSFQFIITFLCYSLLFKDAFYSSVCGGCGCVHLCQKVSGPLELDLQLVMNYLIDMLGINSGCVRER